MRDFNALLCALLTLAITPAPAPLPLESQGQAEGWCRDRVTRTSWQLEPKLTEFALSPTLCSSDAIKGEKQPALAMPLSAHPPLTYFGRMLQAVFPSESERGRDGVHPTFNQNIVLEPSIHSTDTVFCTWSRTSSRSRWRVKWGERFECH